MPEATEVEMTSVFKEIAARNPLIPEIRTAVASGAKLTLTSLIAASEVFMISAQGHAT
jgi:hypothetical protein